MNESKSVMTARLRAENRWEEASLWKDAEIKRLRDEGLARREAGDSAWESMAAKYPPLDGNEAHEPEPSQPAVDSQIEALLKQVDADAEVHPDLARDVEFAYRCLDRNNIDPKSVPSTSSLSLLLWARANRNRFFEVLLPKVAARFDSSADKEIEVAERKSIAELQTLLGRFVDAGKPNDLETDVERLVGDWSSRNRKRLSQEAKRDLEASIGDLVGTHLVGTTGGG